MFFTDANAENVSYLHALKKISYPVAKFLFKLSLNERIYNLSIGRNLNTRKLDYTSIFKFRNPKIYLKRLRSLGGDAVLKEKNLKNNIFPIMFHDALINPKLILDYLSL